MSFDWKHPYFFGLAMSVIAVIGLSAFEVITYTGNPFSRYFGIAFAATVIWTLIYIMGVIARIMIGDDYMEFGLIAVVILGAVLLKTASFLAPEWIHVRAETDDIAVVGFVYCFIYYLVDKYTTSLATDKPKRSE